MIRNTQSDPPSAFPTASLNVDFVALKAEANKRLRGDIEAENPSQKKKVGHGFAFYPTSCDSQCQGENHRAIILTDFYQRYHCFHCTTHSRLPHGTTSYNSPLQGDNEEKMLKEFCRDLCAEVRAGRIDPVSSAH